MFTLIQALHKKGILTEEQVSSLKLKVRKSKKREEEVLLKEKKVDETLLFKLKSELIKVPLKETITEDEEKLF